MKQAKITSFSVYGLFGTNDVHIPFNENVKILIGENGLGKTQILNLFYYTLKQDFSKLSQFNFERLVLEINGNESIEIKKDEVDAYTEVKYIKDPRLRRVVREIGKDRLVDWFNTKNEDELHSLIFKNPNFRFLRNYYVHNNYPASFILDKLKKFAFSKKSNFELLEKCKEKIDNISTNIDIMYFPTYRRIEEDLHNLGYKEEFELEQENSLIQFGMTDVKKQFKEIENKIDRLLKEGLADFTAEILNVVLATDSQLDSNFLDNVNDDDIDIILARVGGSLPEHQKKAVKNIVAKKQFKNPLSAFLLQKLINIYEKQKELDTAIKKFRDICNKYLVNKQVFYDESKIDIYIKSNITNQALDLSKLSSGEKQILSIFSKIYLSASENEKRFMVLFDEPELSLSIFWQEQLLPDIINSGKCDFLLAVTHSPFIFNNKLRDYAITLKEHMKVSEKVLATK